MPKLASRKFTDRYVSTLKPKPGLTVEHTDAGARGLTLRITPLGTVTWFCRYSVKGTGQRKATIGQYPRVSIADARKRAHDITDAGRKGVDLPVTEAAQVASLAAKKGHPVTVEDLILRWVEGYAKKNLRRWKKVEAALKRHAIPRIGKIKLAVLRRADIVELKDHLMNDKGLAAQAGAVAAHVSGVLAWGVDRDYLPANPAATIRKLQTSSNGRTRILTDDELRAVWLAAVTLGYPASHFVRGLFLLASRRNEMRRLPWSEIKPDGWHLPPERDKSKRGRVLPLPQVMKDLLAECRKNGPGGPFVFSFSGERPLANEDRMKSRLDNLAGVTGWTFHDIRRTCRTRWTEMHIPEDVIRELMNHSKGGLIERTYNQAQHHAAMLAALEAWAARIDRLISGTGKVVRLPART